MPLSERRCFDVAVLGGGRKHPFRIGSGTADIEHGPNAGSTGNSAFGTLAFAGLDADRIVLNLFPAQTIAFLGTKAGV